MEKKCDNLEFCDYAELDPSQIPCRECEELKKQLEKDGKNEICRIYGKGR
jgi:hypothetical protein